VYLSTKEAVSRLDGALGRASSDPIHFRLWHMTAFAALHHFVGFWGATDKGPPGR